MIRLQEYSEKREAVLTRVFQFLGVQVHKPELRRVIEEGKTENVRQEEDRAQGDMLDKTRRVLQDFYQPYNVMLARYFQDSKLLFQR